jgi:FKBP-type peptidyl-prolyl cis-trans isomerase FkpA
MRRITGFFFCLILIFSACNKTTVTLTDDEILARDIATIDEYLEAHNINAIKLESGVRYVVTENTDGPLPTKDNCIKFRYTGYEVNDTIAFQTNTDGFKAPLKSLVVGMQIGLKNIPEGGKGMVFVPSALGYGSNGSVDANSQYVVHPDTPIWFEVELLELYDYNSEGNYCYE